MDINFERLNFADYNIGATYNTIQELISNLHKESQAANDWSKSNEIIVNPNKLQANIVIVILLI